MHTINAIDIPITPDTSPPEEIILIRAKDVVVEETNQALNNSIIEHETSTPNQVSFLATLETQTSRSEASKSESISSLMAKMNIKSKRRFRILRTRSPYGRKLKFQDKRSTNNELSSSLLDETSTIKEDQIEEPILAHNNIKEEETPIGGLPLSESSVVEESKVNAKESSERGLPLTESSVVEESKEDDKSMEKVKPKSSFIKNVGFFRSKWTEILIEDEEETPNCYDVKKEIFEMMRRQEQQAATERRDDLIRVNRKMYAHVEVNKDRNDRTLYVPLPILPNGKL